MSENGAGSASDAGSASNAGDTGAPKASKVADRLYEHQSSQEHLSLRERASEKAHEETTVRGRTMERGTIFKFIGLLAFIAILTVIMVLLWPSIKDLFNEGGTDRLVARLKSAGPLGVLALLGIQFLQIVVALIPGEVVQLAAGLMYGPWLGALIILLGCVLSSFVVYQLVHKLGAPFVRSMVSEKYMERFERFEKSGKLDIIVFVLFLIPGMPKDIFTYIVPLTSMKVKRFLTLTTIARIPGVLASTYMAHGFSKGDIVGPIAVMCVVALLAVIGFVFRERIMNFFDRKGSDESADNDEVKTL
ncbi:MAG: TVP38/TMEM64 family protein [Actinomycetaceae bacterium]|nr:TVP38/TMEM64 family protein [Actinomycetaceae bacterium]